MGALLLTDEDISKINQIKSRTFRGYSKATGGGGAIVKSTKGGGGTTRSTTSGGGTTATSSSGGGTSKSTQSGGGTSQTSSAGGDHRHRVFRHMSDGGSSPARAYVAANGAGVHVQASTPEDLWTEGSSGNHSHSVSVPNHSHSFTVPNHTHTVTVPNHSHEVSIPNHSHEVTLPNHTHEILHGIFRLSELPTSVEIRVDGNLTPYTEISGQNLDLIPYLARDSNGKIKRGAWHEVSIKPDKRSRVNANVISRLFIQSLIGGTH
ncbi:hypothetical protein JUJ52_10435 [Virgibacillus sp. AGTR]|uniref:hypothetical protein n=1 Tax=Virgibacillus sp. AGTR TaxID=2812055 RepID=UPI001D167F04|nr:hypothetical protein [Virgibacillus sp. AGTR]MCC2250382.1 hypothetical protein [Virgibacillus sp. AGTR]